VEKPEKTRPLVAVVDDEESVRRALDRLLRSARIDVATFASGDALLEAVAALQPDCVLLDLRMPGLDGFATQARLAERAPGLPVVVLTAQDGDDTCERAMRGGAAAFLRKPVDGHVLLETIFGAVARASGCAEDTWERGCASNGKGKPS
jgi:FixJ family two-component response regulator